jgi:hypothetical protein
MKVKNNFKEVSFLKKGIFFLFLFVFKTTLSQPIPTQILRKYLENHVFPETNQLTQTSQRDLEKEKKFLEREDQENQIQKEKIWAQIQNQVRQTQNNPAAFLTLLLNPPMESSEKDLSLLDRINFFQHFTPDSSLEFKVVSFVFLKHYQIRKNLNSWKKTLQMIHSHSFHSDSKLEIHLEASPLLIYSLSAGDFEFGQQKFSKSLKHYQTALKVQLDSQNVLQHHLLPIYLRISWTQVRQGLYAQAEDSYLKGLSSLEKGDNLNRDFEKIWDIQLTHLGNRLAQELEHKTRLENWIYTASSSAALAHVFEYTFQYLFSSGKTKSLISLCERLVQTPVRHVGFVNAAGVCSQHFFGGGIAIENDKRLNFFSQLVKNYSIHSPLSGVTQAIPQDHFLRAEFLVATAAGFLSQNYNWLSKLHSPIQREDLVKNIRLVYPDVPLADPISAQFFQMQTGWLDPDSVSPTLSSQDANQEQLLAQQLQKSSRGLPKNRSAKETDELISALRQIVSQCSKLPSCSPITTSQALLRLKSLFEELEDLQQSQSLLSELYFAVKKSSKPQALVKSIGNAAAHQTQLWVQTLRSQGKLWEASKTLFLFSHQHPTHPQVDLWAADALEEFYQHGYCDAVIENLASFESLWPSSMRLANVYFRSANCLENELKLSQANQLRIKLNPLANHLSPSHQTQNTLKILKYHHLTQSHAQTWDWASRILAKSKEDPKAWVEAAFISFTAAGNLYPAPKNLPSVLLRARHILSSQGNDRIVDLVKHLSYKQNISHAARFLHHILFLGLRFQNSRRALQPEFLESWVEVFQNISSTESHLNQISWKEVNLILSDWFKNHQANADKHSFETTFHNTIMQWLYQSSRFSGSHKKIAELHFTQWRKKSSGPLDKNFARWALMSEPPVPLPAHLENKLDRFDYLQYLDGVLRNEK